MLSVYIILSAHKLLWIALPDVGKMSSVMKNYRRHMALPIGSEDVSRAEEDPLGQLNKYYYNNRDLKLLLDLLAANSGAETSLCVLALFDSGLGDKCRPGDLKFTKPHYHETLTETNIASETGCTERLDKTKVYDIGLTFEDCPAMTQIFSFMENAVFLYTVEVLPATRSFSVEAVEVINVLKYGID